MPLIVFKKKDLSSFIFWSLDRWGKITRHSWECICTLFLFLRLHRCLRLFTSFFLLSNIFSNDFDLFLILFIWASKLVMCLRAIFGVWGSAEGSFSIRLIIFRKTRHAYLVLWKQSVDNSFFLIVFWECYCVKVEGAVWCYVLWCSSLETSCV